ncbi:MAG: ATP-binding cassette domain-containing protein [Candidatus Omnitrophica bacterium]|nr:ATP-binding cassette domain-containing protein [Candidatus Omnitrophota bacterium]
MNEEPSLAVKVLNLTKFYEETLAVDHINFEVENGEIFGFLGPNGAGKTTTIRILAGILVPDKGEAKILGINVIKDPLAVKQIIGVVPEVCNVYIDLSAWENMMLMGKLYGVKKGKREKKTKELLQKFDLWERENEKTGKFSKGMKQRLILAMSLIHNSEILFLDEPTSGLDVQSSRMIRKIMQELKLEGKTIFLTTHNIEEANLICNKVAIINKGKIIAIDTPEKLKNTFQKTQSIEVAFDRMLPNTEWIKHIPQVNKYQILGDKLRLYTPDPDGAIRKLTEYSKKNKLCFISLNILGPSLEDVFVKLTEEKEINL